MSRHRHSTRRRAALIVAAATALAVATPAVGVAAAADGRRSAPQVTPHATEALSPGALTQELLRIAQVEARQEAAREAARRARRHQAFLDRWVLPIHAFTWSAGFGDAGGHWSTGYHTGQDFAAPTGTPVYAAVRGTITFAAWSDAYGHKLEITDYDGTQTWYAHLSAYERTSGTVKAGELVGYVGCTGNCFGSHLHFEVHRPDGEAIDPVPWLRAHGVDF